MSLYGIVDGSGSAELRISADFNGSEGKEVFFNVSGPVRQVSATDKSGLPLEATLVPSGNDTLIYVTVPVDHVELDVSSDSLTRKEGTDWDFDLTMGASQPIDAMNATLALPAGTILKSTNGAVEAESSLLVRWSASDIDTSHRAHMKAGYELTPQSGPQDLAFLAVIAALLFVALAYIRQGMKKPAGPPPADKLESNRVFATLDETDKEIVRELHRQGGRTTQARLNLQTHVPKATLSRRLASLEGRGIIKRSQKGNRNLVSLTDMLR
jgi:uncharacterized membrane protein